MFNHIEHNDTEFSNIHSHYCCLLCPVWKQGYYKVLTAHMWKQDIVVCDKGIAMCDKGIVMCDKGIVMCEKGIDISLYQTKCLFAAY